MLERYIGRGEKKCKDVGFQKTTLNGNVCGGGEQQSAGKINKTPRYSIKEEMLGSVFVCHCKSDEVISL